MEGHRMLIGAHVSAGGGFENAVVRGVGIKADIIQIFTRNQMQWHSKPLDGREAESFRNALKASGLRCVIAHASYLLNFASPDEGLRKKSVSAALEELGRCEALGVYAYIFHAGSHRGSGEKAGMEAETRSIGEILDGSDASVRIAVETMAGQGNVLCNTFEELHDLLQSVGSARLGVCIDTCHIFAAGYDIRDRKSFSSTLKAFNRKVGAGRLIAMHLNDSKGKLGSGRDRHANIGKGEIGKECFASIMHTRSLSGIPMALETPGGEAAYRKEIKLLRSL